MGLAGLLVHRDPGWALRSEGGPIPVGPLESQTKAGRAGHVQLCGSGVLIGLRVADQFAVVNDCHPVVGPGHMADRIGGGLDTHVIVLQVEDPTPLPRQGR